MKKKTVFLINGLTNSGSEQSLISFLDCLDYDRYTATVLVLKGPDDMAEYINPKAEIKYLYKNSPYFDVSLKDTFSYILKNREYTMFLPSVAGHILKHIPTKFCRHTLNSLRKKLTCPKEEFDICVAYEYVTMKYMVNRIKAGKKIVRHNYGEILPKKKDMLLFEKCDRVVALTPVLKEELAEKFSIPKEKIAVIPSNFDRNAILKKAEEYCEMTGKYRIVSSGRLTELKRCDLIIKAVNILKNKGYDIKAYIIGGTHNDENSEKYFHQVRDLAKDLGLTDSIVFTGEVSNPFPYVKNCDIYVQSSDFEAASRSVIEALILKKPCLSTDTVGGKALIKPGKNGELAERSNYKDIAEKLEYMLNNREKYTDFSGFLSNEDIMKRWEEIFV